jgi:hypothetical protein
LRPRGGWFVHFAPFLRGSSAIEKSSSIFWSLIAALRGAGVECCQNRF